jgi:hypothetical protein
MLTSKVPTKYLTTLSLPRIAKFQNIGKRIVTGPPHAIRFVVAACIAFN